VQDQLWARAQALLPHHDVEAYTQGLMDLGAVLCTRRSPRWHRLSRAQDCVAHAHGLVAKLPTPRPAKPLPQRETRFAVMLEGDTSCCRSVPRLAIWGGMWCFPEAESDAMAADVLRFGAEVGEACGLRRSSMASHTFSLRIHPVLMQVKRRAPGRTKRAGVARYRDGVDLCIPAPVRTLLELLTRQLDFR
jgi:A/G-specific adenine glycosylase